MAEINDNDMKHALKQAERKGRRKGWFARIRTFFVGIIAGMLILTCFTAYMHGLAVKDSFKALFTTETAVENRDLTLINHRIFGFKVADFADAVLGDEEQLKKLEVYSREVSDVATLTQAGLFKIKAFSKYQVITYNGKAVYTVTVHIAGVTHTVSCPADTSLLRAMEAAGLNPPSDCRSGRCGWCHSQLLQGDGYVPESVDGRRMADKIYGYIHPCCTFPLSDCEIDVPPMPYV